MRPDHSDTFLSSVSCCSQGDNLDSRLLGSCDPDRVSPADAQCLDDRAKTFQGSFQFSGSSYSRILGESLYSKIR